MATNYPIGLDAFTNPTGVDSLNSPSHSQQHADANDAIEALEIKLGIGNSPAGSATAGRVLVAGTGGTTTWTTVGASAISTTGGSAGQVLTAGTAGVAEWAYSGLTLIKTQTIGSAVSEVTVSDVFSANYDSYKIIINSGVGSTSATLDLDLVGATDVWSYAIWDIAYTNSQTVAGGNNYTKFPAGVSDTTGIYLNVELHNPYLAKYTYGSSLIATNTSATTNISIHKQAASFVSFTVAPRSGTITGGTIRVYGFRNS